MSNSRSARLLLPAAAAGVLALAACGSNGGGGNGTTGAAGGGATATPPASSGAATGSAAAVVKTRSTALGTVLTNSSGRTLYVSDQEQGKVLCKSAACTSIWTPLTVPGRAAPEAPGGVTLGTITRPDGAHQLTLKGQPLYTFSFDHAAGSTGGEGVNDSFDGTDFTWHAARTGGARPEPSMSSSPSSNGYNY